MDLWITRLIKEAVGPYDFGDLQPFVFDPYQHESCEFTEGYKDGDILACPFSSFSIEMDGGTPITSHCHATDPRPGVDLKVLCLYCKELSPGSYDVIALFQLDIKGKTKIYGVTIDDKDGREEIIPLITSMLAKLHNCNTGTIRGQGRVRYKTPKGQRKLFKPKGVIYITGKANKETVTPSGKNINWSHEWAVRAHWRSIGQNSIGVGRDGKRNVPGYTWVSNYRKGQGPVVNKIRKVATA